MTKLLLVFVAVLAVVNATTDLTVTGNLLAQKVAYFGFGTAVYPSGNYNGLPLSNPEFSGTAPYNVYVWNSVYIGGFIYDNVYPAGLYPCSTGDNCYAYSDRRIKNSIISHNVTSEIMHKMNAIETVSYEYLPGVKSPMKRKAGATHNGFIAQDIMNVFPDVVTSNEGKSIKVTRDGYEHEVNDPLYVNMANLVPHLVEAVQYLSEDLGDLKTQADSLLEKVSSSPSA